MTELTNAEREALADLVIATRLDDVESPRALILAEALMKLRGDK